MNITVPDYILYEFNKNIDNGTWWRGNHHYAVSSSTYGNMNIDQLWDYLCNIGAKNMFVNDTFIVCFDHNGCLDSRDEINSTKIYINDYPVRKYDDTNGK